MEFTLLFAVLTAAAAMLIARRLLGGRLADVDSPFDAVLGAAVIGMLVGRIAAMVLAGVNPLTNPFQIILVRAGVETSVAAPVAVLTLVWLWRRQVPAWIDAVAPMAVAGLAGWHAGCLWRGTCLGTVSDLPWAYGLPGSTVTRHPVELYTAAGLLLVAVVVSRLPSKPWLASGAAIAGSAAIRLITEPLRPSLSGGPVVFYGLAIAVGITVMILGPRIPERSPAPGAEPVTDPP